MLIRIKCHWQDNLASSNGTIKSSSDVQRVRGSQVRGVTGTKVASKLPSSILDERQTHQERLSVQKCDRPGAGFTTELWFQG